MMYNIGRLARVLGLVIVCAMFMILGVAAMLAPFYFVSDVLGSVDTFDGGF